MGVSRTATVSVLMTLGLAGTATAGEIRGTVQLDGVSTAPTTVAIESTSEHHPIEGCGALTKRSPQLIVDAHGGVQHAVVWIEVPGSLDGQTQEAVRVLDQQECVFEPHVVLMPVGGSLAIKNSDPVLHNVRIFQERTMLMHKWQQPRGADLSWRFDEPGRFLVRCGVHSWMYAWVIVGEHRYYAVTDHAGGFALSDVPAGGYTLHMWHETLGEQSQHVTVTPGQSVITVRAAYKGGST